MAVTVEKDVVYDDKYHLLVDVYQDDEQKDSASRGAIIAIHGGGWWLGDKASEETWARDFVAAGYLVFAPNYRLAPDYFYPAPVQDMLKLVDWLKASNYAFDRRKIGAVGMSAGGNLAIELGMALGVPIASWSGIIDLDQWIQAHPDVVASKKEAPVPGTPPSQIDQKGSNDSYYKWFVLNYVNDDEKLLQEASLLNRVPETAGPMFIANSLDEIVPNTGVLKLQKILKEKGIESVVHFVAGSGHGEAYRDRTQAATLDFFTDHFRN